MKKRQTAVQASTIAKVVALSIFLGGSGVGYVFQKSQIRGLNRQLNVNGDTIKELEIRRNELRFKLEQATTRESLEASAHRFGLPLREPERGRTISLIEPELETDQSVSLATHQ